MSEGSHSHYSSPNEAYAENEIEDIDMEVEEPTTVIESQIFTEHIPLVGKVPLGNISIFIQIVFYFPDCEVSKEL